MTGAAKAVAVTIAVAAETTAAEMTVAATAKEIVKAPAKGIETTSAADLVHRAMAKPLLPQRAAVKK